MSAPTPRLQTVQTVPPQPADRPQPRLRACNNYVVVRLDTDTAQLVGRHDLFIPSLNGRALVTGTVTSVGPDARLHIPEGATAIVPPYGVGHRLLFQRRDYLIILDHDILGYWSTR